MTARIGKHATLWRVDPQVIPVALIGQCQVVGRLIELFLNALVTGLLRRWPGMDVVDTEPRFRPRTEGDLIVQRTFHQDVDFVVTHVGIDGHPEVARWRGRQAAVPAVGRQGIGQIGITNIDRQMSAFGRACQILGQLDRLDRTEIRLKLGQYRGGKAVKEGLAILNPLPHVLAFVDVTCIPEALDQVVGIDDLIGPRHRYRTGCFNKKSQEFLIDGDGSVQRRSVQSISEQVHRLLGGNRKVRPEIGISKNEQLKAHEIVERLRRKAVWFSCPIVDLVCIAKFQFDDLPILDDQNPYAGQEPAGRPQLVLVLGQDEIASGTVLPQQCRKMWGNSQPVLCQWKPLV